MASYAYVSQRVTGFVKCESFSTADNEDLFFPIAFSAHTRAASARYVFCFRSWSTGTTWKMCGRNISQRSSRYQRRSSAAETPINRKESARSNPVQVVSKPPSMASTRLAASDQMRCTMATNPRQHGCANDLIPISSPRASFRSLAERAAEIRFDRLDTLAIFISNQARLPLPPLIHAGECAPCTTPCIVQARANWVIYFMLITLYL